MLHDDDNGDDDDDDHASRCAAMANALITHTRRGELGGLSTLCRDGVGYHGGRRQLSALFLKASISR